MVACFVRGRLGMISELVFRIRRTLPSTKHVSICAFKSVVFNHFFWWQLSTRCSCPCALLAHVSRARIYLSAYENFLLYLNVILPCTCVYTLHVRNFCVVWECRCAALKITQHHKLLSFSPLLDEKSEMERILILNRFRRARARWRRCFRQKLRICKLELISLQTNLGGALFI